MDYIKKSAEISGCGQYRYYLTRVWDKKKPVVGFVCLNPSTADGEHDDHTLKRCVDFANSWGFGSLHLVNLFALRSKDPNQLKKHPNPVGPENDRYIKKAANTCAIMIAAWSDGGKYLARDHAIRAMLPAVLALKVNASGSPAHPSRLRKHLVPFLWI